ncbi:MAG: FAD:protein FMN transferase [Planctomycetaceae bacterium]|nr:FAD:protein FMN transferase [Planctomycetaceae bacterium]
MIHSHLQNDRRQLPAGLCPPLLTIVFLLFSVALSANERFEFTELHMGVDVRIILYAPSSEVAERVAKEAFASFHALNAIMSDYDSESELMLLDASRGWIRVSDDLFAVLKAAKHYSTISDGMFDVTVGPMVRLWRRSRRQQELPREQLVEQAKQLVGNHLWEIDEKTQSVRLLKADMKFDLGAIAKGYAIDKAFEIIERHGITSQLVDAGGDFRLGAAPPGTEGWRIAKGDEIVWMKNTAMATSGGRFQFVVIDGVRYAHIVDPRTGLGITGSQTVHIIAPTAMEADTLATAVILLGREKGQALIDKLLIDKVAINNVPINEVPKVSMEYVEPEHVEP